MSSQTDEDGWWQFLALCGEIQDPKRLDEFFALFLTLEEKEAITGRYLIIRDLIRGDKPQRQMSKDLGVSIAKITRGSNSLKIARDELKQLLVEKMT